MNSKLLQPEVQQFLRENEAVDPAALALKPAVFPQLSNQELAQQLEARQKAAGKLPTWYARDGIYYPPRVNLEQTSSELTARYKSELVSGNSGADLTGGFGVDSYYLSKVHKEFYYCEQDPALLRIARHNFKRLGAGNIYFREGDGLTFLQETDMVLDTLFVDPSRRSDHKGKVFRLEDCSPDLSRHIGLLERSARHILVKASPLLDLQAGRAQLRSVRAIHILAQGNEVKELLFELRPGYSGPLQVHTRNWNAAGMDSFDFSEEEAAAAVPDYRIPSNFLYEPNAAILKSGAFDLVGNRYGLQKLARHSHLYTSEQLMPFPGRRFRVLGSYPVSKKGVRALGLKKANVSTRNFPLSVAALRKKYALRDGGEDYLFFTTNMHQSRVVIHCRRVILPDTPSES